MVALVPWYVLTVITDTTGQQPRSGHIVSIGLPAGLENGLSWVNFMLAAVGHEY